MQQKLSWCAVLLKTLAGVLLSSSAVVCLVFLQNISYYANDGRRPDGALMLIIPLVLFGSLLAGSSIVIARFRFQNVSGRTAFATGLLAGSAGFGLALEFLFAQAGLVTFVLAILLSPFVCWSMARKSNGG